MGERQTEEIGKIRSNNFGRAIWRSCVRSTVFAVNFFCIFQIPVHVCMVGDPVVDYRYRFVGLEWNGSCYRSGQPRGIPATATGPATIVATATDRTTTQKRAKVPLLRPTPSLQELFE